MNRIIIFFTLAVFAITISCKKEETIKDVLPSAVMTAKINGVNWTSVARVTEITNGKIIITGTGTSTGEKVINITVFSDSIGTYKISANPPTVQFTASYNPNLSTLTDSSYVAYSGTIAVLRKDITNKKLSGTFSFKASKASSPLQTLDITDGVFTDLYYTGGSK